MNNRLRAVQALLLMLALAAAGGSATAQQINGEQVYQSSCAMCHRAQGQGSAGLAPPLKGSQWIRLTGATMYLPGVMLAGMHGALDTDEGRFVGVMPTQNRLSDAEIAAVSSYLVRDINGQAGAAVPSAAEVAALRAKPVTVAELRALRKRTLAQ